MEVRNFLFMCLVLQGAVIAQYAIREAGPIPKPVVKSLQITSDINYNYAITVVSSTILNPADVPQEVRFRAILPDDAFITGLKLTRKGKSYEAFVKGNEDAKREYNTTVEAGQSAVFQDFHFSKDFVVSVNAEPEEKVNFDLTYEELLPRNNKTYKNEINLCLNEVVDDLSVVVNIDGFFGITNVRVSQISMNNENNTSKSESSSVKINGGYNKTKVEWKSTEEEQKQLREESLNWKMIIKYDVDASKYSNQILVDCDGYFLHVLRNDQLQVLNKHMIFVLDVSGSMHGAKMQQLKDALSKILGDLSSSDYFSLVLFSDGVAVWDEFSDINFYYNLNDMPTLKHHIVPANKKNIEAALKFIRTLSTYGGTNIMAGLRNGLKLAGIGQIIYNRPAEPIESMIIFITDGSPNVEETNYTSIIGRVISLNNRVAIFSLGIGPGAEMDFLKKLSLTNKGFARKIDENSDVSLQLHMFYKEIASPLLSNIRFQYKSDQVEEVTSVHFNHLFSGSEIIVLGKVKPNKTISGNVVSITWRGEIKYDITPDQLKKLSPCSNEKFGHLQKIWAYKTIKSLLHENTASRNDTIENKAKELAVKYSFVTPLTSLIVLNSNNSVGLNSNKSKKVSSSETGHSSTLGMVIQFIPSSSIQGEYSNSTFVPPKPDASSLRYTLLPYQNVSWLDLTDSALGYIVPPSTLQTSDIIALNEANITNTTCVNGNVCRHFVYCVLREFANDISKFIPFQCQIETKFLGVCCPL